jgi:hypothetical protein
LRSLHQRVQWNFVQGALLAEQVAESPIIGKIENLTESGLPDVCVNQQYLLAGLS